MYLDYLDKSPTSLPHQTKKRKHVITSKCLCISIGLCIVFSLVVAVPVVFIGKFLVKSNNKSSYGKGEDSTPANQLNNQSTRPNGNNMTVVGNNQISSTQKPGESIGEWF